MYMSKQKQTHRYRKQTDGYQRGEGRGEGQIREEEKKKSKNEV